jgi:hypothetical protein
MIEQIRRKYRGFVIPAALTAATAITVATSLFNHTLCIQSVRMVGSIGMRRGLINRGDWSDGLERQGSNPWPTTILHKGETIMGL